MIDFSTLKELYVDGKKVTSLFLDGHEVPFGEEPIPAYAYKPLTYLLMSSNNDRTLDIQAENDDGYTVDDGSFEYRVGNNKNWEEWQTYNGPVNIDKSYYQVQIRASASQQSQFYNFQIRFYYTDSSTPIPLYEVRGNIFSLIDYNNGWENGDLPEAESTIDYQFASLFSYDTLQHTVYGASQLWLPEVQGEYTYSGLFNGSGLQEAPVLRAKTLTLGVYSFMFSGCLITTAPELPATKLADECYSYMFENCTALTAAPEIPADEMMSRCCQNMFDGCTSLSSAPALPATTLADSCYCQMFYNCTSLTTAPALPAMTLADSCYCQMFQGCTSLATAPELPAETLADNCYFSMFEDCTSLTDAPALPAMTLAGQCYFSMFQGCTSLATAPTVLPATTLASSCYDSMFQGCSSLTSAPALPAMTLAYECYGHMFQNCTSLSAAPALPAMTLAQNCYVGMFQDCTSLSSAPALPATTLANTCYSYMFQNCTSLASAPALPATTLASNCYNNMFNGCTSLSTAPALPATTLADYCYAGMFSGCESLSSAPMLPATTLANDCYAFMFYGSSSLSSMNVKFTAWSPSNATNNWLSGVASSGKFICPEALGTDATIQRGASYCPTGWTVVNYDANLKFTAEQANSTVALSAIGTPPSVSLLKSTDGETWTSYTVNDTVTLADIGDYVCFKADSTNNAFASSNSNYNQFVMTGKIAASGSIMKLLGKDTLSDYAFAKMFAGCSALTQAPKLPATTLADYCYSYMFDGCTSLSSAPALPATTLAGHCYFYMFYGSSSLSSAPALPATTLADSCYRGMFSGCTSLSSAPALPATTLADRCYSYMFNGCTSLSSAPALPATTLANTCYQGMFGGCTSLSDAPELPATTLASNCYEYMFQGSSSLSSMNVKFTAWSPSTATNNWLFGVAATGTFKCPVDLDTTISDVSHIPSGWTVVQPTIKYADYVKSNNYVLDTLYKPTVNTSLSTCLSGNAGGQCFIGFNYGSDTQDYRLFNSNNSNRFFFDMGSEPGESHGGRVQTDGWSQTAWTDISAWNFGFKFTPEGGSEHTATGTRHSTADWDANGTINIAGYTTSTGQSDMCIKFLKIYESNVLVRDFKAAVDANDVAGLYDEVEGEFYYPTGGAWTAFGVATQPL